MSVLHEVFSPGLSETNVLFNRPKLTHVSQSLLDVDTKELFFFS